MKTCINLLLQSLRVYLVLICILCFPCIAFSIEPIATIGKPIPDSHAFLNNDSFLRVLPTHFQIIDSQTGEVVDEFGELTKNTDVIISPNATHLAVLNHLKDRKITTVSIWDTNTHEQISLWEIPSTISDLAGFSPTQPILATILNREIHLWNWQTGESAGTVERKNFPMISDMRFSSDGRHIFLASGQNIEVWNVETLLFEGQFDGHSANQFDGLAISPDGSRIASFDFMTGFVYMWDSKSRHLLWETKNSIGKTLQVIFSPDSQILYAVSRTYGLSKSNNNPWEGWDDKVRLWDVKSGQQIDSFETKFRQLRNMVLSPNGKTAILGYYDAVVVWDIENKKSLNELSDTIMPFDYFRLSPDGKSVLSVAPDYIKAWDIDSQEMRFLIFADEYRFQGLAISPDSKYFAVCREPTVELRDIQTGQVEIKFPHPISVWHKEEIAYSTTGKWIAAVNTFRSIVILDVENPEKIQRITPIIGQKTPRISAVGFSPNDEYLAVSCSERIDNNNHQNWILLWKRVEDTFVFQYAWQASFPAPSAFTTDADGSTLLVAGKDNEPYIWKLTARRAIPIASVDIVYPFQFSTDGRYLISNGQIWDWRTSRLINQPSFPEFDDISQDRSVLLSYNFGEHQYLIWDVKHLLSFLPYPVEPKGKMITTLGLIKRNQLLQNFPNPFNPETWIPFRLADESSVTIDIYSSSGELVRSISTGNIKAGDYSAQSQAVHWDGKNNKGEPVSSGIYFYTINAGDFSATRKMLIKK